MSNVGRVAPLAPDHAGRRSLRCGRGLAMNPALHGVAAAFASDKAIVEENLTPRVSQFC